MSQRAVAVDDGGQPGPATASAGAPRTVRLRRPSVTILLGSLAGQGSVLAVSPLLTRLYSAEAFGALAVLTSLAAIGGAVATTGWERAVVAARSEALARALVALAALSTTVVSVAIGASTWLLRDRLADRFDAPVLADLWWLVPVTVAAIGGQRIAAVVLTRRAAYGSLALRNATQGLAQVATNLALAPAGGALGLLLGLAVGRAAGLVGVLGTGRRSRRGRVRSPLRRRTVVTAARRYRRFPLVSTWSGLLNAVGLQAPTLVLATSFGPSTIGLIALGSRVVATPVGIVAEALGQHFDAAAGAVIRGREPRLSRLVLGFVGRASLLAGAGCSVAVLASPWVIPAVFGDEWRAAVPFTQLLSISCAAQLVVVPVSRTLTLLERQSRQLAWDAGRLALTCGAVVVAVALGASALEAMTALVAAGTASYASLLGLVVLAARRHDRHRRR